MAKEKFVVLGSRIALRLSPTERPLLNRGQVFEADKTDVQIVRLLTTSPPALRPATKAEIQQADLNGGSITLLDNDQAEADQSALEAAQGEVIELRRTLTELTTQIARADGARQAAEGALKTMRDESAQTEAALKAKIALLEKDLASVQAELAGAQEAAQKVTAELATAQAELKKAAPVTPAKK